MSLGDNARIQINIARRSGDRKMALFQIRQPVRQIRREKMGCALAVFSDSPERRAEVGIIVNQNERQLVDRSF